jgi:uncharacterized protein (UPF0371 family)
MGTVGFDNEKYLADQSAAILERIGKFDNKLYLEFGGKIIFDYHASRVLPGFDPNVKMRLLQKLKDRAEIVLCIHAGDIERRKVRADFGITYESDAFKLIDELRDWDLTVRAVVITRFADQPTAIAFKNKLERRDVRVYVHRSIPDYLTDLDRTVSDAGFGSNPYIETTQPLVVITAPGPNSGKMGTCLGQVFHEHRRGVRAGYAKFETFPIWNLPLKHEVNAAYEAATADLRDYNLIDPFHLEAYGVTAVNYNRDVEAFPLLRRILERISGEKLMYRSPTDMGVNRAGFGVVDDAACREAGRQEIVRRYFHGSCEYATGRGDLEAVRRLEMLMDEYDIKPEDRPVVRPAIEASEAARARGKDGYKGVIVGAAIRLPDGTVVTGTNSPLMHAAPAVILNAAKRLAELPKSLHLLSDITIESIGKLKKDVMGRQGLSLDLDEALIALAISATTNPTSRLAMDQLRKLRGCECHLTHMPTPGDERSLKRLGMNVTSVPSFETNKLFVS